MTLGQKIRTEREKRHWSPIYLGIEVGAGQTSVYQWENDERLPRLNAFFAMVKAFNMSFDEFMKGVEIDGQ